MNSFDLSRSWFNYSFDNPEKVKPIHSAIFFFAIEHCNRLGNKEKFGFPSQMTMDAIGVKNYQTYGKALKELEEWGFITFIERSKNQYSANIISISAPTKNSIARGKALDKATLKHDAKQAQSKGQGIVSIDKPVNHKTNKPINHKRPSDFLEFKNYAIEKASEKKLRLDLTKLELKYDSWKEAGWVNGNGKKIKNWKSTLLNTLPFLQKEKEKSSAKKEKFHLTMDDLDLNSINKLDQ